MPTTRIALSFLWISIAASVSTPFLVASHTYPIPTFYSEFCAAVCGLGVALSILALTWRSEVGLPKIALAPVALIVVLLIQLTVATPLNPFFSYAAIVFLLGITVVCGLGARCRDVPGVIEALAIGLILGAVVTVGIETIQLLRVPDLPAFLTMLPGGPARRMWGNLYQPNHVASYLAFGLAACFFLASRWRRARVPLAIVGVLLLWGITLTVSRTTWLLLIAVGILQGFAIPVEERGWRAWIRRATPLLMLLMVYQLCNWAMDYGNARWHWDLPGSLSDRMQQGVGFRSFLWNHAWHMFLAHPWLGAGWGDYAWNQYVQTDVLGHVEMAVNAHNIVLDLLAKVGVIGLLAVAIPFFGLTRFFWKQIKTPTGAFLWAIITVMGIHSMLEFPLHYLFFLLPFVFALGYVDTRTIRFPSSGMVWVLSSVMSVCTATLLWALWSDYRNIEKLFYATDGVPKALASYQTSSSTLLLPYATLVISMHATITPELAPIQVALERQAVQFYPGSSTVQLYALALALLGKTDEAVVQVRRLYNQYWTYYGTQSQVLTASCAKKKDDLKEFCSRLKAENLLVESK